MYGVGEGLTRCPACLADLGSGIGSDDVQIPEQDAEPLVDLESDSISASPTVPYASTRSHAATLRLMFTVWAALAGASAAASFAGFLMTRRALSEPFAYDQDQLQVWDDRSLRLGVVLIAAGEVVLDVGSRVRVGWPDEDHFVLMRDAESTLQVEVVSVESLRPLPPVVPDDPKETRHAGDTVASAEVPLNIGEGRHPLESVVGDGPPLGELMAFVAIGLPAGRRRCRGGCSSST